MTLFPIKELAPRLRLLYIPAKPSDRLLSMRAWHGRSYWRRCYGFRLYNSTRGARLPYNPNSTNRDLYE
jgi:hypothetical protein